LNVGELSIGQNINIYNLYFQSKMDVYKLCTDNIYGTFL